MTTEETVLLLNIRQKSFRKIENVIFKSIDLVC